MKCLLLSSFALCEASRLHQLNLLFLARVHCPPARRSSHRERCAYERVDYFIPFISLAVNTRTEWNRTELDSAMPIYEYLGSADGALSSGLTTVPPPSSICASFPLCSRQPTRFANINGKRAILASFLDFNWNSLWQRDEQINLSV